MLRCQDCEFYRERSDGTSELLCDPFSTIKEPECLAKLQLTYLKIVAQSHQATLDLYQRFAPLQERMLGHIEREIDEADDADRWKIGNDEDDDDEDESFHV